MRRAATPCRRSGRFDPRRRARAVMIGTTHFTNAIVEARRLAPTAAIRLGLPATARAAADGRLAGARSRRRSAATATCATAATSSTAARSPRSTPTSCARSPTDIAAPGASRSVAISVGLPPGQRRVRGARPRRSSPRSCPACAISLSHEIGRIGLLERENATIMNAACASSPTEIADGVTARDRRRRHQRAAVPHPERRHADGRRATRAATRSPPSPPARPTPCAARRSCPGSTMRGGRHRRHDHRCRHPQQAASRARRRPRSTSAACAPTSACPTCSSSASAAAAWSAGDRRRDGRPGLVGYRLTERGAGVRRRRR